MGRSPVFLACCDARSGRRVWGDEAGERPAPRFVLRELWWRMHPPVIAAVNRRATQNRAEEIKGNGGGQECPPHTGWLGGQVVNQAVGVLDVDPGNLGLVFDYLAALLHQLAFGFLDIFDCNLKDRAQGWTFFDEEI